MGVIRGWFRALVLLSGSLSGCLTDPGYDPPIECAAELEPCERECVDVLSDPAHCGECGALCGSDALCVSGECVCGGGLVSCESGCTDVTTDPQNCGACGTTCEQDEVCSGGRCAVSCRPFETECKQSCVDTNSNPHHCGNCSESCDANQACAGGRCACAPGTQDCDGECTDLASDRDNCGACGASCAAGQICSGSRCVCPGGTTACDGGCVDLFSDGSNCGACGDACGAGEVCSTGQCQASCNQRLGQCEDSCVDLDSSDEHCGECETACSDREICVEGACQCPPGHERCADTCVDLGSDERNCGSCGFHCAADQGCNAGQCECPSGGVLCGTACVDTEADPRHCGDCNQQCGDDEVCSGGACRAGCSAAENLCGSSCVDLETSGEHCGDCAQACDPNLSCLEAKCACPGSMTLCGGVCVDTSVSITHCGECDRACADDETCIAGQCEGSAECSDSCPHPSGISWDCQRRFMYGVNYGWEHYAGDFGGIPAWSEPGVADNEAAVDARLADMAAQGVDVVRWWVWPDFRGDGVKLDGSGTPTGLGPTAIADLEKALQLASDHDLHLMLTLFSFDNFRPTRTNQNIQVHGLKPIATDSARRAALIDQVVRPFARAAEHSDYRERLIAWDVINEPEWAMMGPSKYCSDDDLPAQDGLEHLTHDEMELFVSDVVAGLRAESHALVTVGGAATLWACAWKFVDIDFYQFHMYDWIDQWSPYDHTPAYYGITDKPAIIGEFPMNGLSRASYTELVDYWYDNGWAGALGWAVTERGANWDESKAAVGSFSEQHSCEMRY